MLLTSDNAPFCLPGEHRDQRQVSDATGVSVRALAYKLPAARQALASILDRLDLL